VAGLASYILVRTPGHGLFNFDMTILTRRSTLDMTHAAGSGLVAVDTLELF
jgi:hypothetical protein